MCRSSWQRKGQIQELANDRPGLPVAPAGSRSREWPSRVSRVGVPLEFAGGTRNDPRGDMVGYTMTSADLLGPMILVAGIGIGINFTLGQINKQLTRIADALEGPTYTIINESDEAREKRITERLRGLEGEDDDPT